MSILNYICVRQKMLLAYALLLFILNWLSYCVCCYFTFAYADLNPIEFLCVYELCVVNRNLTDR